MRLDIDNTKIQPKLVTSETYSHYYTNRLPQVFFNRLIDTFDVDTTCSSVVVLLAGFNSYPSY